MNKTNDKDTSTLPIKDIKISVSLNPESLFFRFSIFI
jgi:hypothetical protein